MTAEKPFKHTLRFPADVVELLELAKETLEQSKNDVTIQALRMALPIMIDKVLSQQNQNHN